MSELKTMMLYTSYWGDKKTFKLMPITKDCPFVEGIYDKSTGMLVIIGKDKKEGFHMVPKLDDQGRPMPLGKMGKTSPGLEQAFKQERRALETYPEYYLMELEEIEAFVEGFALNTKTFNYKKHLNQEAVTEQV
jgi:hypothetical protein